MLQTTWAPPVILEALPHGMLAEPADASAGRTSSGSMPGLTQSAADDVGAAGSTAGVSTVRAQIFWLEVPREPVAASVLDLYTGWNLECPYAWKTRKAQSPTGIYPRGSPPGRSEESDKLGFCGTLSCSPVLRYAFMFPRPCSRVIPDMFLQ